MHELYARVMHELTCYKMTLYLFSFNSFSISGRLQWVSYEVLGTIRKLRGCINQSKPTLRVSSNTQATLEQYKLNDDVWLIRTLSPYLSRICRPCLVPTVSFIQVEQHVLLRKPGQIFTAVPGQVGFGTTRENQVLGLASLRCHHSQLDQTRDSRTSYIFGLNSTGVKFDLLVEWFTNTMLLDSTYQLHGLQTQCCLTSVIILSRRTGISKLISRCAKVRLVLHKVHSQIYSTVHGMQQQM